CCQSGNVTREGSPGEWSAGRQVGAGPDPRLALEAALDLLSIRSDHLAHARNLVHERDRGRQERINSVLGHFCGLEAHEYDLGRERSPQSCELVTIALRLQADHHAIGLPEGYNGVSEPQIFRAIRE